MATKKDRRHSGRKTTKIYDPVNEPYERTYWDDWIDWRDGFRDWAYMLWKKKDKKKRKRK